jgi:aspartyl-tRNA(Asn)/glutamyl-tRNA(Gln) amidotransferase subunit A
VSPAAASLAATAAAVRSGASSAERETRVRLERILRLNPQLNAFTEVFDQDALEAARAVDDAVRSGLGGELPLAGVAFAAKDLFDIAGRVTTAGSSLRRVAAPAAKDAELVARLRAAGAILIGRLNMDEFAYGFVTENSHYGPTRNPHDLARTAGGSSGGSAAAVAASLVPLTLGTDTNGSIRVPAALCGVYGLKPTYGRLSTEGVFPLAHSLDHAGPFARRLDDLALAFDVCAQAPSDEAIAPRLERLADRPLRTGLLGGWFARGVSADTRSAVARVAEALHAEDGVVLQHAEAGRSAAFCLTAVEGGRLHVEDLKLRLDGFDPAVGVRLLAGALLPENLEAAVLAVRRRLLAEAVQTFARYDVLVAPVTAWPAPEIGQQETQWDGQTVSVRKSLGVYTQPLSFIGVPIISAPVAVPQGLPIGVQLIAAPGREDLAFAAAARLERMGVLGAPEPLAAFR